MPVLPDVQTRRGTPQSQRRVRGYSTAGIERANNIQAASLQNAARDIGDIGLERERRAEEERRLDKQEFEHDARVARERYDKDALLTAQDRENNARLDLMDALYGTDDKPGLYSKKGSNALGVEKDFESQWGLIKQNALNGIDDPNTKNALEKSLDGLYQSNLGNVKRYRNQERTSHFANLTNTTIEIENNRVGMEWNNPESFYQARDNVKENARNYAITQGLDVESTIRKKTNALYENRIRGMIATDDPNAILAAHDFYNKALEKGEINDFETSMAIEKMLDPVVSKAAAQSVYPNLSMVAKLTDEDDIIGFVVDKIEGGDKIAREPGGAFAKFGINSKANPDVDVFNLDREGAVGLYKQRYWKSYGVDKVSEDMRLLAFDTAVNHRSDFAKDLIKKMQDGATYNDILNARLKEYQRLARENPEEYGQYMEGWKGRLMDISSQLSNDPANVNIARVTQAANNLERAFPGAGSELMSLYQKDVTSRDQLQKARKTEVQNEVSRLVHENQGDYTSLPASLRSEAASLGIDITQYKGVSNQETLDDLDVMTADQLLNIDLDDPAYAQNLNYEDLQKYREKQNELGSPDGKHMQQMIDNVAAYYFQTQLNKSADELDKKENKGKVSRFKQYIEYQAKTFQAQQGKMPTAKDLNGFAAQYVQRNVQTGFFGGRSVQEIELKDIPQEQLRRIENMLIQERGVVPTEQAVIDTYQTLLLANQQANIE